jgi:polyisoprenoid-binding protein YceI
VQRLLTSLVGGRTSPMRLGSCGVVLMAWLVVPVFGQQPNEWTIDSAHSAASFAARHMLVSTVRGEMGPVKGTILWDGKDVRTVSADVTIDVTHVNTREERRDQDLRSENFFDAANYPTMTFKSKRAEPAGDGHFKLIGDLTIRGNTHEVVLNVDGPTPAMKNGSSLRVGASATTTISRKAFGLLWNKLMETGGAVVGDDIQVQIDIEAFQKVTTS